MRRAWRPSAPTLFAPDAFDALAFAPAPSDEATPAQVALGEALFFEPALSIDSRRSCATCHQPAHGFADTLRTSISFASTGVPIRNTPTVVNSSLQGASFTDMRASFLEDQVADVLGNVDEMHQSLEDAVAAVASRPDLVAAFGHAFPDDEGARVTAPRLRQALSAYLRSLQALDSRFDRYARGDAAALSAEERLGLRPSWGRGSAAPATSRRCSTASCRRPM